MHIFVSYCTKQLSYVFVYMTTLVNNPRQFTGLVEAGELVKQLYCVTEYSSCVDLHAVIIL